MALLDTVLNLIGAKPSSGAAPKRRKTPGALAPTAMGGGHPGGVILLAELDGARGAADSLAEVLEALDGLVVDRVTKPIKLATTGTLAERLYMAADVGRKLLANSDGDLLIYGEGSDAGLTLRFVARQPSAEGAAGPFGLGDTLELPPLSSEGLTGDLGQVLAAATLAALFPGRDRAQVADMLTQAADRAAHFLTGLPASLTPAAQAATLVTLGHVFQSRASLGGRSEAWVRRASEAYEKAANALDPDNHPLTWAVARNHLASNFLTRAEGEKDPALLESAVAAYRDIADRLPRDAFPTDWALAQGRLGMTLYKLAARASDTKRLKESVTAFEAALSIQTRDEGPARWAELQNQLGVTLMALGQQVQGNKALEQSAAAFRSALEVRRRDQMPLLWAQTANNLGAVAFALTKRGGSEGLLSEAEACFEGAGEVFREHGKAKMAAVIDKNLDRVRARLKRQSA
ncbi:MAG: hypothetical protein ACPGNT_01995 [Rhodospirillales bacterium]